MMNQVVFYQGKKVVIWILEIKKKKKRILKDENKKRETSYDIINDV